MQQRGLDFLHRDAIVQGALDVQLQFVRVASDREHGEIQQTSGPAVECFVSPRPSPCPRGGGPLKRHHEGVGFLHRSIYVFRPKYGATDRQALFEKSVVI